MNTNSYKEGIPGAAYIRNVLAKALTALGESSTIIQLGTPTENHMCTATWTGTAPSGMVFQVEGSEDGVNFAALATVSMSASPTIFHIKKPAVLYLRVNLVSITGGDSTTGLTLTCTSGGN